MTFVRKIVLPLVSAASIVLLGVATLSAFEATEDSDKEPWPSLTSGWIWAIAITAGVTGPLTQGLREWREEDTTRYREVVEPAVMGIEDGLTALEIDNTTYGQTVFVVIRPLRWLGLRRLQVRVLRRRHTYEPRPTEINWSRRKGPLGECWRTRQRVELVHKDRWEHDNIESWRDWWSLPSQDRYGLTYRDYRQIANYGTIHAYPLVDQAHPAKYYGCLVIQFDDDLKERFDEVDVRKVIGRNAELMCAALHGLSK